MTDPQDHLNNKAMIVLNEIARDSAIAQRALAKNTGISLGLINTILKKLIHVGYIKASNLNKKKLKYLLTPEGLSVQTNRTYHFILSTIQRYQALRSQIKKRITSLIEEGFTDFIFTGDGEVGDIVEMILKESQAGKITVRKDAKDSHDKCVFLTFGMQEIPTDYKGKVADFLTEVGP